MTEVSKESHKPTDAENEATPAQTVEQPEEWVRKKVVPSPPDDSDKSDNDRSPGGSGRSVTITPPSNSAS